MGTVTFVEEFKEGLQFTRVDGEPNVYFIQTRRKPDDAVIGELTDQDWDKFERDIDAAFEQVP